MEKVVLKFSGEFLKGDSFNVDKDRMNHIVNIIKSVRDKDVLVSVVIGGGNYFRGGEHAEIERVTGDTIGMLGTVMNSLFLKDALIKNGIDSLVTTPFDFPNLLDNYSENDLLETSKVVIFGGGIGKSGYSTDSAVVNASRVYGANLIIKLTNVDGVYDSDPKKNKNAIKYNDLTFDEAISKELGVMDMYAFKECQKLDKNILVTDINDIDGLLSFFDGKKIGTIVHN